MKVHILIGIMLVLSFLFGFELASSKGRVSYDLYKFTQGQVDLVEKPVASPKDRISEQEIFVTKDEIILDIQNVEWSSYEPTGSMEPVLSENANGLYVIPKGPEDIKVGDIIAYSPGEGKDIVHRVIDIDKDENGNYFYVTKGDANPVNDPQPVPYQNVKRVLVGILY